jgi:polyisoprenoid-binding protein YceI
MQDSKEQLIMPVILVEEERSDMTSSPSAIDAKVRERLSDGSLAGTWRLDGAQSAFGLKSRSIWGLVPVKGEFAQVSGEGTISADGTVTGSVRLSSASVDTKNKKRDDHLRSADFFNSGAYPDIIFTVDHVDVTDTGASAVGTLEVAGQKRPLEVPLSVTIGAGDTVDLDAEIQVDRSDFGLTWNRMGMVSMDNTITVHAVFTRDSADGVPAPNAGE